MLFRCRIGRHLCGSPFAHGNTRAV
jgi:hypothetical protein